MDSAPGSPRLLTQVRQAIRLHHYTQALSGLLFLYRQVLGLELDSVAMVRPAQPVRLPVVLGREEVRELLGALTGIPDLVATLLYGSGLRLLEALQLKATSLLAVAMSRLRAHFIGSLRARLANGPGSMCFRRREGTWIRRPGSGIGIISTSPWCSERSSGQCRWLA